MQAKALSTAVFTRVALPLRHERDNVGTIVDATGRGIVVVDMHREMPDDQVSAIADMIVLAVNEHLGFPPLTPQLKAVADA